MTRRRQSAPRPAAPPAALHEPRSIDALAALMQAHDLLELEVVRDGERLRLVRAGAGGARVVAGASAEAGRVRREIDAAAPASGLRAIASPMVGTFHRASAPAVPPFVELGDVVERGQVLCLIEAMKMMNEIEAECRGRVQEILVGNGTAVEYGQPLFLIDPA